MKARILVASVFAIFLTMGPKSASAVSETPIGPGVAGQTHALAMDPANPQILYAGGDNCGIYKSNDFGATWERWNEGLSDLTPRYTSYVDDLLVIPSEAAVPSGVWAATRGGIAYRADDASDWSLQTSDLYYDEGYARDVGASIPFACLSYDEFSEVLYAGAGNGRLILDNVVDDDFSMYPECGTLGAHSLWYRDASGSWVGVSDFGNQGPVYQIDSIEAPNGDSWVVVAAKNGVWLGEVVTDGQPATNWTSIFDETTVATKFSGSRSWRSIGVGVGKNGTIYTVARLDGNLDPGVYYFTPASDFFGGYDYSSEDWEELESDNPAEKLPPQDALTWHEIILGTIYTPNLLNIVVNPGDANHPDEVIVGAGPGDVSPPGATYNYTGYYRHGECPDGVVRWQNMLFRSGPWDWDDPTTPLAYSSYENGDFVVSEIADSGWMGGFATGSTVHPICWVDPNGGDTYADSYFVVQYHYTLANGGPQLGANPWTQQYSTLENGSPGYQGYYRSTGLNIMGCFDLGFKSGGELVLGCGDFLGFEAFSSDPLDGFRHLSPYFAGEKDCKDVEIVGDEIFMVRPAPSRWASSTTGFFDYTNNGTVCDQEFVIASYDETLDGVMSGARAGFLWRYHSQDIEPYISYNNRYSITDIEFTDETTMFAAVRTDTWNPSAYVLKATRPSAGSTDWTWSTENPWWSAQDGAAVSEIHAMNGSDRLLLLVKRNPDDNVPEQSVLVELDPETPCSQSVEYPKTWLSREWFDLDTRRWRSLKYPSCIESSPNGDWLYVGTSTQGGWGWWTGSDGNNHCQGYHKAAANVVRLAVPQDGGVPSVADWEFILNAEDDSGVKTQGIDFGVVADEVWPAHIPVACSPEWTAEVLPLIRDIAVHPKNPKRIFVGLRVQGFKAIESFHPHNGVWEYDPSSTGSAWQQIEGEEVGEPSKGNRVIGLVPGDPTTMAIGSMGQEFFWLENIPDSTPPVSGVTAVEPVYPDQSLLMLAMEPAGTEVVDVWVDATELGLDRRLHLVDDGNALVSGDWEAGDGIWTADVSGYVVATYGVYELPCCVRDADWNTYNGAVSVEVLDSIPAGYFRNVSADVVIDFSGTPSGFATVDLRVASATVDDVRDVAMSQLGATGQLLLQRNDTTQGLTPVFGDQTNTDFANPLEIPGADHGAVSSADFDNDGRLDLVVPSGSNAAGLLFFREGGVDDGQSSGKYILESAWNPLASTQEGNTWRSVCADYDGDGATDIYLCRAVSSGGLPGSSSAAASDVLLRNSIASDGSFADVSSLLEPTPVNIATTDAAWCDFDGDGDLDLAVAGATAGQAGVFIYEHSPAGTPYRFDLLYPADPSNPTWALAVSDIAWADLDSDGLIDLVASTFDGRVYHFANAQLTSDPALVFTSSTGCSGVNVVDHDLDGDQDLLLTASDADGRPVMAINTDGVFGSQSQECGLNGLVGASNGALAADFNQDGTFDLFLGRAKTSNKFLAEGPAPTSSWVGIRLIDDTRTPAGSDDWIGAPAIGATVVVKTGESRFVAFTLGNGGNGSDDGIIRAGLDPIWTSPMPICDVYWPSGHVSEDVALSANSVTIIKHQTDYADGFQYLGTPYGRAEVKPQAMVDYVFRWTTSKQTNLDEDKVIVSGVGVIDGSMDNVEVTQWVDTRSGAPQYVHELVWRDRQCTPGKVIDFWVYTGRGGHMVISDQEYSFISKICTSVQHPQQ